MYLVFLIPLITALVTGYIAYTANDEITYLTGAVTVIFLLVSLILAPWPVQLLILLITAFKIRNITVNSLTND
uniref:Uncharacterized protein n=1 Tax=Gloeothece verrucosa (strain PCC 7822) TaxID=497965 RepID=E0UIR9_GLOV7|nr:conserved hypothetical protein [Gloeothece verrucosa PCC 7822]